MLRLLAVLAAAGALFAVVFASASTLTVDAGTIQAGEDMSTYCDADGVYVDGWGLETDDNTVRSVRIGGIDDACNGADMFVRVYGRDNVSLFYSKAVALTGLSGDNNMKTFNFDPYLKPEAIEGIKVWIEGSGAPAAN